MALLDHHVETPFPPEHQDFLKFDNYDQLFQQCIETDIFDFPDDDDDSSHDISDKTESTRNTSYSFSEDDPIITSPGPQWEGFGDKTKVPWSPEPWSLEQRQISSGSDFAAFGNTFEHTRGHYQHSCSSGSFPYSSTNLNKASVFSPKGQRKLKSVRSTDAPSFRISSHHRKTPKKSKSNPATMRASYHQPSVYRNPWSRHFDEKAETLGLRLGLYTAATPQSESFGWPTYDKDVTSQPLGLGIACYEEANRNVISSNAEAYQPDFLQKAQMPSPGEERQSADAQCEFFIHKSMQDERPFQSVSTVYEYPLAIRCPTSPRWNSEDVVRDSGAFSPDANSTLTPSSHLWSSSTVQEDISPADVALRNALRQHNDPMLNDGDLQPDIIQLESIPSLLLEDNRDLSSSLAQNEQLRPFTQNLTQTSVSYAPEVTTASSNRSPSGDHAANSNNGDQKRRSMPRLQGSSHSRRSSGQSKRALSSSFVNFTASDSERLLSGVAPSGSSKTKARREKEAEDKRRRLSEAAKRAVMEAGGDITVLDKDGLLKEYLESAEREFSQERPFW